MTSEPLYDILTYDPDLDDWTHQVGLPPNPIPKSGLKAALYRLREMGYPADYAGSPDNKCGDPSIRIIRIHPPLIVP